MTTTEMIASSHPAGEFWGWADFGPRLQGLNRRQFMRLADSGDAPPYTRWTSKSPPMWNPHAVQTWIDQRVGIISGGDDDDGD